MVREFDSEASIRSQGFLSDLALDLAPEALRAYDSIVRPNAILPIPRYFIENWLPLLGASRAWLVLSFRQVAFISQNSEGEIPVHTTLRKLGHWCGLSHVRIHQVLKEPGYLNWFVRNPDGDLSQRSSPRSQPSTFMVRADIPLTPQDQSRLSLWFEERSPADDQEWIHALEEAPAAKKLTLPKDRPLPQVSLTIQQLVYTLRGKDSPLPPGIDQACTELHARWVQPDRVTLATHYFLVRWLPDLSPGLGWLITLLRSRAYHQKDEFIGQVWIKGGWRKVAESLGVSRRSLTRWVSSTHANLFFQRRVDEQDPTDRRNMLLAVRLSEPIHPTDQDEYQIKLEGQSLTSPIPIDSQILTTSSASQGQSLTSCGDPSTEHGKDLTSNGQEFPSQPQNLTREGTSFNKHETKLNSLKDSFKSSYQELNQDMDIQLETVSEIENNNVVVEINQWQIAEVCSRAGVGKRMRRDILESSIHRQTSFIAWILFALSIPTIQYPVLFAYKRNQETSPPESFNQLAQMPVQEFYGWLVGNEERNIPAQLIGSIQQLRKQRAHEKLLSMGAIHPGLDEWVVSTSSTDEALIPERKRYTPPVAIRTEEMTAEKAWHVAKGQLQSQIDKVAFDTWVKDVEYMDFVDGEIQLGVANDYAKQWLKDRLTLIAERVLSGILGERIKVQFVMMYDEI
jgi:hypothetical protein